MEQLLARLRDWIALYGLQVVGAVAILVVGRWVARALRALVARMLTKAKTEPILVSFVGGMVYVALMTFVIVAALSQVGVQTASFIAVVGAAGLAVGLALQGSLANFAAGVLLMIFRPLRAGDVVEAAGAVGKVEEVQIFTTTIVTPDNKTAIVPNAKLTGDNIVNYTRKGTRRLDMVFGVAYDADLQRSKETLEGILAEDGRVLKDPPPLVAVGELADSSVNFFVRPWVKNEDYWDLYFDTTRRVKERLDAAGIGIPFPQRDVHLYQNA